MDELDYRRVLVATAVILVLRAVVDAVLEVVQGVPLGTGSALGHALHALIVFTTITWLARGVARLPWLHALLVIALAELISAAIAALLQLDMADHTWRWLAVDWLVAACGVVAGVPVGRRWRLQATR